MLASGDFDQFGDADIFLDHLPINVRYGSSSYEPMTSSILKRTHASKGELDPLFRVPMYIFIKYDYEFVNGDTFPGLPIEHLVL